MNPIWMLQQLAGPPLRLGQALHGRLEIGRALDNDLVLLDPAISRRQARLSVADGPPQLEALAGTSRVNGEALPIGAARPLQDGDRLEFGPWQLCLVRANERIVPASLAPTLARDRLGLVHEFCRRAAACRDEAELVGSLLDAALHGSGCDRVLLLRPQAATVVEAARPADAMNEGYSQSLVEASADGMVQLEHLAEHPSESMLALGITQALCLPLPGDERGRVLYLDRRDRAEPLPPQAAIFVQTLAESAGLALTRLARERAMAEQRQELWRDLHDELGSFLLARVYAATTPEAAGVARDALAEVRRLVSASRVLGGDSRALLAALQTECEERCAAADCTVDWDGEVGARPVGERGALDLMRLVREWIGNSLRHGRARRMQIRIADDGAYLSLCFEQPQARPLRLPAAAPEARAIGWPLDWTPGTGLRSIESRLQRLEGDARIEAAEFDGCNGLRFECRIPWHRLGA